MKLLIINHLNLAFIDSPHFIKKLNQFLVGLLPFIFRFKILYKQAANVISIGIYGRFFSIERILIAGVKIYRRHNARMRFIELFGQNR